MICKFMTHFDILHNYSFILLVKHNRQPIHVIGNSYYVQFKILFSFINRIRYNYGQKKKDKNNVFLYL